MLRRLPGWPGEELSKLLVKFHTPFFDTLCDDVSSRKLSDETVALNYYGSYCGSCHVVSFKLFIACKWSMV